MSSFFTSAGTVIRSLLSLVSVLSLLISGYAAGDMPSSQRPSLESQAVEDIMSIVLVNKFATEQDVLDNIESSRIKNEEFEIPKEYIALYSLETYEFDGVDIAVYNAKSTTGKYIFYFCGGAYVDPPLLFHWTFLDRLSRGTDATVIMPVYLKGPDYTYRESYANSLALYEKLLEYIPAEDITFMGDSAGGSYALSLAIQARDALLPLPGNIVMFSPWVDMTMSNPEIPYYESIDPMIVTYGVRMKGETFAGDTPLDSYILSPINADLSGLPDMMLFVGTKEVLLPDCRLFRDKALSEGATLDYYEYEDMLHTFPIFPIPESDEVVEIINQKIN